ncbi:YrdB family protein [Plantactinospora siamensis]|uniref:YrdB family protein n=1 Tax=Plantactinospora siamensis TaxID=555372 RepID=A0ABV6NTG6_9ACTN
MLRGLNLTLRFLLELVALAALGYGGWQAGWSGWSRPLLAVLLPVAGAVLWGLFVAPRARYPLPDPLRLLPEWVVFGGATLALLLTGHPVLAVVFAVLAAANRVALRLLDTSTGGATLPG